MGDKEALTVETLLEIGFQLHCRLEVGGGLALAYIRLSLGAGAMQVDLTFLRCLDIWGSVLAFGALAKTRKVLCYSINT